MAHFRTNRCRRPRSVKRPRCTATDRALLVLLTSRLPAWRHALLIVQPETVLRWHRDLFRRVWRHRSQSTAPAHRPPLAPETVALIRQMAAANRLWGAERIRGELLKLDIRVAKRTIQKYMRASRPPHSGQTWATFLHHHGHDIWAADFLPVTDLLFRPLYAFFVIELASRRVVHVGVTRHPTDARVAQQLRDGSVRRECLDHVLVLNERHLVRVLRDYVTYFNSDRPHQGLEQRIPEAPAGSTAGAGRICTTPVLGGLHHSYHRAA